MNLLNSWKIFDILSLPFEFISSAWNDIRRIKEVDAKEYSNGKIKQSKYSSISLSYDEPGFKKTILEFPEIKAFRDQLRITHSNKDQNTYCLKGNFLITSTGYSIAI